MKPLVFLGANKQSFQLASYITTMILARLQNAFSLHSAEKLLSASQDVAGIVNKIVCLRFYGNLYP